MPRYEAHFNSTEATHVVQSSSLAPTEPQNALGQENITATGGMLTLPHEESADDMLIDYFSKDPLGDLLVFTYQSSHKLSTFIYE
jgi:hypothetical protein